MALATTPSGAGEHTCEHVIVWGADGKPFPGCTSPPSGVTLGSTCHTPVCRNAFQATYPSKKGFFFEHSHVAQTPSVPMVVSASHTLKKQ